jgi:hypothetical protein
MHAGFVSFTAVSENIGNTRLNTVVVVNTTVPGWSCADPSLAPGASLTCALVEDFSTQALFEAAVAGFTLTATVAPLGVTPKVQSVTVVAEEQAAMTVESSGSCTVPDTGE